MNTLATAPAQPTKAWNIGFWTLQVLLAALFCLVGAMKLTQPIADLARQLVWPGDVPIWLVRFIGACELAGGIGLVLPAATRILPWLTPAAAIGIVALMVSAFGFHVMRGEFGILPMNLVIGGCAALVAWGRLSKRPMT